MCVCGAGGGGLLSPRPQYPFPYSLKKKIFCFHLLFYANSNVYELRHVYQSTIVSAAAPPPLRRDLVRAWIYMHMNPVLQESYLRQYYVVLSYVTDYDRESMNEGWVRAISTPPPPPPIGTYMA